MLGREHLETSHQDALVRLVRAGTEGLRLGDGICISSALLWAAHGCASITNTAIPPQRAVITVLGRQRAPRGTYS